MRKHYASTGLSLTAALATALTPVAAWPVTSPYGQPSISFSKEPVSPHQPVVLQSDQLDYDKTNEVAIATGHVEVTQGQTVLLADTLMYDRAHNTVYAQGHVTVLEPSGNVYFAEDVELSNDMATGVAEEFKARFSDGSLFAAREAERKSPSVTKLLKAVYSPCSILCADGTPKTPQWQIEGGRATIDRDEQRIVYRDAYMEAYGVPVFYTPYFSHPTPGADNKSGLLTPTLRRDGNLGNVVAVPIYWAISQDKDLTITPLYASAVSPVLIGEYHERFDNGRMYFDGSITRTQKVDEFGNTLPTDVTRGHLFAQGDFNTGADVTYGFNIRRSTDDTYLRVYGFNNDSLLTSRIYSEAFNFGGDPNRSYAVVEALAFQGMLAQDDPKRSPLLLPVGEVHYASLPMAYNSRFTLTGGMMSLTRQLGDDSRRLDLAGDWTVPYVTDSGHVFSFSTKLRADGYNVNSLALPNGSTFTGTEAQVMPEARLDWRYPLMKQFTHSSLIVEPVADMILSTSNGNSSKIPNEDSLIPEFTDANLFSDDRFAGYDRVETGPRAAYGVRSQWQLPRDVNVSALAGQAYRANNDTLFPLSNDVNSHFSDYVGRLGFTYGQWFDAAYRFRLDKDTLSVRRTELNSTFHVSPVTLSLNYLDIAKDPILDNNKQLFGGAAYELTKEWTINANSYYDLLRHAFVEAGGGLTYHNECMTVVTSVGRNFTSDRDYQQSTTFQVQVFLKNLN